MCVLSEPAADAAMGSVESLLPKLQISAGFCCYCLLPERKHKAFTHSMTLVYISDYENEYNNT